MKRGAYEKSCKKTKHIVPDKRKIETNNRSEDTLQCFLQRFHPLFPSVFCSKKKGVNETGIVFLDKMKYVIPTGRSFTINGSSNGFFYFEIFQTQEFFETVLVALKHKRVVNEGTPIQ